MRKALKKRNEVSKQIQNSEYGHETTGTTSEELFAIESNDDRHVCA